MMYVILVCMQNKVEQYSSLAKIKLMRCLVLCIVIFGVSWVVHWNVNIVTSWIWHEPYSFKPICRWVFWKNVSSPPLTWSRGLLIAYRMAKRLMRCYLGSNRPMIILRYLGGFYFAHVRPKDKFMSWSRWCIFVGYPFGQKGWKLYDIKLKNVLWVGM